MPTVNPKSRTLSDLRNRILRPSLTSYFEVHLNLPPEIKTMIGVGNAQDLSDIILMCCETVLPGSNLATTEVKDNFTGVTERHAYRRVFDDRIDLTFYVDDESYYIVKMFEAWIGYISGGDAGGELAKPNYNYRMRYPNTYMDPQGMEIIKFERDMENYLTYRFVHNYPLAINSMPVSYDSSSLLKCTVSMTYIRYYVESLESAARTTQPQPTTVAPKTLDQLKMSPTTAAKAHSTAAASPSGVDDRIEKKMAAEFEKDQKMYGDTVPAGSFGISQKHQKSSSGRGAGRAAFN